MHARNGNWFNTQMVHKFWLFFSHSSSTITCGLPHRSRKRLDWFPNFICLAELCESLVQVSQVQSTDFRSSWHKDLHTTPASFASGDVALDLEHATGLERLAQDNALFMH